MSQDYRKQWRTARKASRYTDANLINKWPGNIKKETNVRTHPPIDGLSTNNCSIHTHTALCTGLPGWDGTRKVKPVWILLKQETVSSSGISWATCKSAPCSRQTTTPAPHHSVFLQTGCPSCRPTNSVKALKATAQYDTIISLSVRGENKQKCTNNIHTTRVV